MSDKLRNRRLFAKMQGYEGLYVLEQHASVAEGNKFLRHRKSMHLRALLKEYLEENNYRLKHESLVEYLDLAQSQHKFDDSELFAVNDMISDLILRRLSESDNPLGDTVLVENCVRTMQQMDVCQFEKMYTQLSEVNAILSEHNLDFYVDCDEQTKRAMRSEVYRYARRHRISEVESAHLYCKRFSRDNGKMGRIYFIAYVALTVAFFVVAVGFSGIIAALLLLIPISEVCRIVVHGVVARFVHPRPIPKLRPTAIPDQAKTLVVITSMLFSNEDTTALMRRLETIYHQNSDPNARFGILADLPESDSYHTREDDALIAHAEGAIGELNSRLGEHFCLFVRSRQQSATHPKPRFSGWERKRGAVIELTRLTRGIQGNFAAKIAPESFLLDTKYIITLDADTNMYIGAVRDFVFTMLHPSNKPVVRNGIVVEGYGVLQPRMATSLSAASATPFSVMISGAGGMDSYQTASFDCYQSLFGEGIFCGKGIFDVDVFLEVVDGAFPEQRVLSHDLLEGTRLRCGLLTELSLTDSCPKTPASFFTRQHRWIRGDVQAAAFAGRKVRNDRGRKVTNPISALSRYMLIDNIRRTLLPILTIAAILKAFFTNYSVFFVTLVALAWLIMPFIFSSVRTARNVNRRFYSTVMQGIWRGFMEFLYAVMSMPHTAILAADAMVRSLWRMVFSRRRLLEWTTAAQSDRSSNNGFFFYYRKMFPSFVAGAIMLFAAPHGMFRLFGVMFALLPLVSYFISRPLQNTPKADGEVKQILSGYARDTWAFYEAFVTAEDNWLPPDNYQELPVEVVAHRTSPTNIAMYMLSTLAAADFGFIGSSELYQRLYDTCSTIEGMVKYRGQLYNWYDTRTLDVIGVPYVSTVDNGNFVTSLLALAQGLEEYALQEPRLDDVIDKLNKFIDESDFSFLYNPDRHLFCIGYDTLREEQSENCYDLLMSEARSTSYFAIARGIVPKEHWHRLGRPTISGGGHIGMASWSGTAFEYFMPPLLLPISKNSLMYECLGFALVEQKLHAHTAPSHSDGKPLSLWGKSESGYFAFDGDMNYQYRAIGTRTLALEMAAGRDNVISPYSSFLSLCIAPNTSIENLQKLKEFGMYGKYGFFEAVDFTPSRVGGGNAIIRSYMAHHVGMSMLAAANVCFDNVFQNRFMSDPQMRAAAELLEERVPTDARVSRDNRRRRLAKRELPGVKQRRIVLPEDLGHTNEGELPQTALISNGSTMLYASSAGDVTLMARQSRSHKAAAITYPFFDGVPGLRTLRLLGGFDGKVVDLLREDATRFSYSGSKARYTYSDKTLSTKAEFSVLGDGAAVNINITAEGKFTSFTPMLALEPILFGVDEFQSHPAFCGLSVTAEYDKKAGVLLFCRRSRRSKEKEAWFAISLEGKGALEFITRRDGAYMPMYTDADVRWLVNQPFQNAEGACIMPFCAIKRKQPATEGRASCDFILAHGESREKVMGIISGLREQKRNTRGKKGGYSNIFAASMDSVAQNQLIASDIKSEHLRYASLILSRAMYCRNSAVAPESLNAHRNDLWSHGISGDLPIVCLEVQKSDTLTETQKKLISTFARVNKFLSQKGFSFDLVFVYSEIESYGNPERKELESLIYSACGTLPLGRPGGIHLISGQDASTLLSAVGIIHAIVNEETLFESLHYEFTQNWERESDNAHRQLDTPAVSVATDDVISYGGGAFHKDGFRVTKDGTHRQPWSFVYSSSQFGTMVTQNSLGYTWFRNAREFRLTPWSNDPLLDCRGERLLLSCDGESYDLCAMSGEVDYSHGCAKYSGELPSLSYKVSAGVDPALPVKLVLVEFENTGEADLELDLDYAVTPVLSDRRRGGITEKTHGDTVFYRNAVGSAMNNFEMYVHRGGSRAFVLPAGKKQEVYFLLGTFKRDYDRCYYHVLEKFRCPDDLRSAFGAYADKLTAPLSQFVLSSGNKALDTMFNHYLLYQAITIRMMARTGFYQSSGAYGYRDQLQDSLAALYVDPNITRRMIYRCAAHQYTTGDVQHWWHKVENYDGMGDRGIKSLCSDDYVWLPYATAKYIRFTGDYSILDTVLPYIDSSPLKDGEHERYELPHTATHKETLYMHCVRALELAISRVGSHGLPLMGTCDWNDGFSEVGTGGKGESVWLARFMQLALAEFATLAETRGEVEDAANFRTAHTAFGTAIEEHCYADGQYLRAFYDDGTPMGLDEKEGCAIDLLPQSFSVMVEGDTPRTRGAMEKAIHRLWDEQHKILKLFDPPFVDGKLHPGYIRGYSAGVRENGGQYTHGALWGVWALFELGEANRAMEMLNFINPAYRCMDEGIAAAYRCEPYALCGDVYSNPAHPGRGGWSLYTGGAAWYYRAVLEKLLGYTESAGSFTMTPCLPSDMDNVTLTINRHDTVYEIVVRHGNNVKHIKNTDKTKGGYAPVYTLNGKAHGGTFPFDGGRHKVEVVLAKPVVVREEALV